MDILLEWAAFLTRWLHVMAGITWIGTSFYFNWFDAGVRPAKSTVLKENPRGILEEVHGGSFYYHEQYWPNQHPERLLVHSWPAKTTFYSGLFLMTLIYWLKASVYLVDSQVADLSASTAVMLSIGSIALSWFYYVALCAKFKQDRSIFIGMCLYIVVMAFAYTHLFSGRGAFISMGAMLGSLMGLNVIRHIVPNHIAMRKQLQNGEPLDRHHGFIAKRHSQHNNYFTIPVVVCMISNHFALAYSHAWAWLILCLLLLAGWGVRHYLNLLYKYEKKSKPLQVMIVGALLAAIAITVFVNQSSATPTASAVIDDAAAMQIVQQRCVSCHSAQPTQAGFAAAPLGLMLDEMTSVIKNKDKILYQVVVTKAMPLANITQLTDKERLQLQQWLEQK